MSKKGKKFDAPEGAQGEQQTLTAADVGTVPAEITAADAGATVSPIGAPRSPTMYLEDTQSGLHYKFDRRNHLPKKATTVGAFFMDGYTVPFQVTSNKGWAKTPEVVIDYLWFTIPAPAAAEGEEQAEGVKGFITLDYTVEGTSFVDREFTLKEGTPNRFPMKADGTGYAQRIGKPETEEARKKAFVDTMAKKKLEKENGAPATEPAATEQAAS